MSAKKILIFNWKMAPQSFSEAKRLFNNYLKTLKAKSSKLKAELVVAPPFVYLSILSSVVGRRSLVKLASQNVFYESRGAYTGEISAKMLKNLGVEYVIIGHSERRKYLNETDEMINKKVLTTLKAGLKVILCVGEDLSIRKAGKKAVEKFIKNQLKKDLKNLKLINLKTYKLIIAYEPLWSIGTGHSDAPEDALEMIKFIKSFVVSRLSLVVPVLYGGSVDSKNIENFLKHPEIDGALVGHASLKAGEVKGIIEIMKKIC